MLRFVDQEQDDNFSADQVAGLDLRGLYQKADKAMGGWLPGGGTGNPLSGPARQAASSVKKAPLTAAKALRDLVIVPAIDKGIESGALPVKEAMFARYLSGTDKPLTSYPTQGKEAIKGALDDLAIENTRDKVDELYKQKNPDYQKFLGITDKLHSLQRALSGRAETGGAPPTAKELSSLEQLQTSQAKLAKRLGLPEIVLGNEPMKLSKEERLKLIKENNLFDKNNMATSINAAYGNALPDDVQLTLGRFVIKNGEIHDRYKFDELEAGRQQVQGRGSVYPDASGGGETASNLIELGLKSGLITPQSGYEVRIPLP